MTDILEYVEDRETSEFYPTPKALADRLIEKIDWKHVEYVLEPSAGKGNLLHALAREKHKHIDLRYTRSLKVDCVELDPNLRAILRDSFGESVKRETEKERDEYCLSKIGLRYSAYAWRFPDGESTLCYYYVKDGKDVKAPDDVQEKLTEYREKLDELLDDGDEIRIVHDDFLTYTEYAEYQAIVMNPPFSDGDLHLLKALEMQKNGGQIACLLNAETIKNPYTERRKHLVELLDHYNADIEYIQNAFLDAERKTGVEVALVYVNIPYRDDDAPSIYERLAAAKNYTEPEADEMTELEVTDMIEMIVNRYRMEVEAGIELIRTYRRMKPYLECDFNPSPYSSKLIELTSGRNHDVTINSYVRDVRLKYWEALMENPRFTGKLTSTLQKEYSRKVAHYAEYDFSEFNIRQLLTEMDAQVRQGIEDEIGKMFDRLTEAHSWFPECANNRYLYDGWKTNKAWKIGKKCILPCYGVFSSYDGRPRAYEASGVVSDIERVLNFFAGDMTQNVDLYSRISRYMEDYGTTKNIPCKFFTLTFYKKGTVHITFTCPELIDRFNIYAAKQRKWLPPSYGEKHFSEMDEEEQAVVNSFQGEAAYEDVLRRADYFLASPVAKAMEDRPLLALNDDQDSKSA